MGVKLRNIIKKILPVFKELEEQPTATIMRMSKASNVIPTFGEKPLEDDEYDKRITVPIIYSEQPEIATSGNNITTQKRLYVYIHEDDLPEDFKEIRMEDRIIFRGVRYKPVGIRYLFGLWEIRCEKV
jgi:hypothetical protein